VRRDGTKQGEAGTQATATKYFTEALERLVQLYDAWGKPEQAQQCHKELEERKRITQKPAK
jgi:hypothetical protein